MYQGKFREVVIYFKLNKNIFKKYVVGSVSGYQGKFEDLVYIVEQKIE